MTKKKKKGRKFVKCAEDKVDVDNGVVSDAESKVFNDVDMKLVRDKDLESLNKNIKKGSR